ncbi:MAG TPA: alpha/beta hydrolase [Chloroflexota bacterium]|nr:alpha/beta hydrolase [Chloroflexota bacterium]
MPTVTLPTGIDMYYETHGSGEPLVLIPSTAFGCNVWYPQVPELSKRLQLIVMDPRGVGRTTHAGGFYTVEQLAYDVVALLDVLGVESAHVLGHSMGGRIALALTLDFPRRVRSLIMAASGSGPATRPDSGTFPGLGIGFIGELVEKGFEKHIRDELIDTDVYLTDAFRASHAQETHEFFEAASKYYARWPEFLRLVTARQNYEGTHRLGDVNVPMLIAVGDKDTGGSNHVYQAQAMKARVPHAELRVLPGQSHGFFWEAPQETNVWIAEWVLRHCK